MWGAIFLVLLSSISSVFLSPFLPSFVCVCGEEREYNTLILLLFSFFGGPRPLSLVGFLLLVFVLFFGLHHLPPWLNGPIFSLLKVCCV